MKKIKIQKPTEVETSLKYNCPNCGLSHWIFLREAKTKNYRIVCDCGIVFKPKQISNIKILYKSKEPKKLEDSSKSQKQIPQAILVKCCKILVDHGFSEKESRDLLCKAYSKIESDNISELIKTSLKLFGELNVKL